jgi:hypothetical protein
LKASSETGKFGPRRANCKFFLATCKKTKYTGMPIFMNMVKNVVLEINCHMLISKLKSGHP